MEYIHPFDKELYSDTIVEFKIRNVIMEGSLKENRLPGYIPFDKLSEETKEELKPKKSKNEEESGWKVIEQELEEKKKERSENDFLVEQFFLKKKYFNRYTKYSIPEKDFMEFAVINELEFGLNITYIDFKDTFLSEYFSLQDKEKLKFLNALEPTIKNYYYFNVLGNKINYNLRNQISEIFYKKFDVTNKLIEILKTDEKLYNSWFKKTSYEFFDKDYYLKKYAGVIKKPKNADKVCVDTLIDNFISYFDKKEINNYSNLIQNLINQEASLNDVILIDILSQNTGDVEISIMPTIYSLALYKENKRLKEEIECLKDQIKYSPDNEGYFETLEHFNKTISK